MSDRRGHAATADDVVVFAARVRSRLADCVAGDLCVVGVRADGARRADAVVVDEAVIAAWPKDVVAVLDHAGPAAASWLVERPVGPAAVKESTTDRLPRVLDDDGWHAVVAAFANAARAFRDRGVAVAVNVADDGLLHACVSPLMCNPPQVARVVDVVAACAPCDVVVVVEDLAPGGLDATAGIALCQRLVDVAQAKVLYATAGTVRLQPLKDRDKGDSVDVDAAFVASAAWVVGKVNADVVALGSSAATVDRLAVVGAAAGVVGVVTR